MDARENRDAIGKWERSNVLASAAPLKIHDSEKMMPRGSRR